MLFVPDRNELRVIGYHLGRLATALSLMMALPAVLALILGEWDSATALATGAGTAIAFGQLTEWRLATRAELTWAHGAVVVALSWLLGSILAAVPFFLSGHVPSLLDAWFEGMSGLTTTGLTVIEDLDHLSYSMRIYRQLTQFVGGQGIVIVMLALFAAGRGVGTLYVAEGREERLVPNVARTARFILRIALVYLVAGTIALFIALQVAGIGGWKGLWHALGLFFAGFDTGGFTPTSQSVAFYHSVGVESVIAVLMIAGSLSFALHYYVWTGRPRELIRNLEVRTLAVTMIGFTALALYGLARAGTFTTPGAVLRKGVFTMLSAHTGTGYAVNTGSELLSDWGTLAPAAIVFVMAFGGMAGSTTGGIKAIRLGLTFKGVVDDVRRVLLPSSAVSVTTYHSGRKRILHTPELRAATFVMLLYFLTYLLGAVLGLAYGRWSITETMFESVSAAANVGLSVGIVAPDMPVLLELVYIVQMWLGRLEFVAVLALSGYAIALLRRRRR